MPVIAGFALAFSTVLTPVQSAEVAAAPQAISLPASHSVEDYIREYFKDAPVMIDIARCESRFRQFSGDGHTLKNPTSTAMGTFQIMASIHAGFAKDKLGLDIYSLQGNAAYARYLYDREGTIPWAASAKCWDKSGKLLARANQNID